MKIYFQVTLSLALPSSLLKFPTESLVSWVRSTWCSLTTTLILKKLTVFLYVYTFVLLLYPV